MSKVKPFSKKVVAFGGGTGLYHTLRGLVELNQTDLITAVPGSWDDGGSSGRLRVEIGVLPSGDIRRAYIASMEDEPQRLVAQKLFNDRNSEVEGPLKGHPIGNLIDSTLQRIYQGQDRGSKAFCTLFGIKVNIEPVSLTNLKLMAESGQGKIYDGESTIDTRQDQSDYNPADRISRIYFDTKAELNPNVAEAIKQAEIISFGPGSLYTSILPHLLVSGLVEALEKSSAKLVLVLNLMSQIGDTDGYAVSDFVSAFQYYMTDKNRLDYIVVNDDHFDSEVLEIYMAKGQKPLIADPDQIKLCEGLAPKAQIIPKDLSHYDKTSHLLRHKELDLGQAILSL